jgi:hypothetical protein
LAHLSLKNEHLWACDVFDKQEKNIDGSGFGVKDYFISKTKQFGIDTDDITIYADSSLTLQESFLENLNLPKFRLISVDGGHSRQITFNDLTVVALNLVEGGIIILDDVSNTEWPGVIDGLHTWLLLYPDDFGCFFLWVQ